jgi:hypothetical protein
VVVSVTVMLDKRAERNNAMHVVEGSRSSWTILQSIPVGELVTVPLPRSPPMPPTVRYVHVVIPAHGSSSRAGAAAAAALREQTTTSGMSASLITAGTPRSSSPHRSDRVDPSSGRYCSIRSVSSVVSTSIALKQPSKRAARPRTRGEADYRFDRAVGRVEFKSWMCAAD